MNLDITYCSNLKCRNKSCGRNQNDLIEYYNSLDEEEKKEFYWHPISIANFEKCEHWKE